MTHLFRFRKLAPALLIALGVGNASAVSGCLSAKAASVPSAAPSFDVGIWMRSRLDFDHACRKQRAH